MKTERGGGDGLPNYEGDDYTECTYRNNQQIKIEISGEEIKNKNEEEVTWLIWVVPLKITAMRLPSILEIILIRPSILLTIETRTNERATP